MGANLINTVVEGIAADVLCVVCSVLSDLFPGMAAEHIASIISNDADGKVATAEVSISTSTYAEKRSAKLRSLPLFREVQPSPEASAEVLAACALFHRIEALYLAGKLLRSRGLTHNKGVLNGVEAVCLACGQDTRAVAVANCGEAPIVGYRFTPCEEDPGTGTLSIWARVRAPVGTVGGSTKMFPGLEVMFPEGSGSSRRLARALAATALLQNFAAMQALAGEGIQAGHMRLHLRK